MFAPLHKLSLGSLSALAASLKEGPLSLGITRSVLQQTFGAHAPDIQHCLEGMREQGMSTRQMALLVDAVVGARAIVGEPQQLFDLVISGPEVAGVPIADTAATIQTLIESAQTEILLVGYAVHNGKRLFKRLAERMDGIPTLRVTFCLDIPRKLTDTSLASEIVRRFVQEFRIKHWPGRRLPEMFYDPRALADGGWRKASLHAKCVVIDHSIAVVTSANFTEAAHHRNIEVGVQIRYPPFVQRLSDYFDGLRDSGQLLACPLQ